jgi:hypothetical protein
LSADSFEISTAPDGAPINTFNAAAGPSPPVPATILNNPLMARGAVRSPLIWLAERIARNRERLGVHYPSDSAGSRHLAAAIWRAMLYDGSIDCPTLRSVLSRATAEWPTNWP